MAVNTSLEVVDDLDFFSKVGGDGRPEATTLLVTDGAKATLNQSEGKVVDSQPEARCHCSSWEGPSSQGGLSNARELATMASL